MASCAIPVDRSPQWLAPVLRLTAIFVFPVVLILFGIIPFEWRFYVLVGMTFLAAGIAFARHTLHGLGMVRPDWRAVLRWAIAPALLLAVALLLTNLPHRHVQTPGHWTFYLFFVLISAPAQEFLYRSFLFAELATLRLPPAAIVLLSTVLFGFMHVIYHDTATVLLTTAVGLAWATVFHLTRRVWLTAVSHAVLGAVAILAGLV